MDKIWENAKEEKLSFVKWKNKPHRREKDNGVQSIHLWEEGNKSGDWMERAPPPTHTYINTFCVLLVPTWMAQSTSQQTKSSCLFIDAPLKNVASEESFQSSFRYIEERLQREN